jgi:transcriptional regulator with XRE-family HTH domain
MSTSPADADLPGFPELTPLGKHIEVLRIGRGLSKQRLARYAGTSRQQLWRVMTGKSELTDAFRSRLAQALQVDASALTLPVANAAGAAAAAMNAPAPALPFASPAVDPALAARGIGVSLETYLASPELAERTLRSLPNGDVGRELKRMILTALEDIAMDRHIALATEFFELRRKVLANEL